jgi:hypothetical protein
VSPEIGGLGAFSQSACQLVEQQFQIFGIIKDSNEDYTMSEYVPSVSVQDEVLDFLVSIPTPQQIISFHASEAAQLRLRYLLGANRNGTLTPRRTHRTG